MIWVGIGIFLVLNVIAIMDCIQTNREPSLRLIWILVILVFPALGMLVYLLFGFSTTWSAIR